MQYEVRARRLGIACKASDVELVSLSLFRDVRYGTLASNSHAPVHGVCCFHGDSDEDAMKGGIRPLLLGSVLIPKVGLVTRASTDGSRHYCSSGTWTVKVGKEITEEASNT